MTKFIHKMNNPKSLEKKVKEAYHELMSNRANIWGVEELVDSHHGVYMPMIFCQMFDIPHCQDPYAEDYWESWEWVKNRCVEDIRELTKDLMKELGLASDFNLWIDTNEGDGSYFLMLCTDTDYLWEEPAGLKHLWDNEYMCEDDYILAMTQYEKDMDDSRREE